MSLDHFYYEELCLQRHRAAWWWRIGDLLYYLGLLPAITALPLAVVGLAGGLLGFGWYLLAFAAVALPAGAVVGVIGSSLKRRAYTLAEGDGISALDVYQRRFTPQPPDIGPDAAADGGA